MSSPSSESGLSSGEEMEQAGEEVQGVNHQAEAEQQERAWLCLSLFRSVHWLCPERTYQEAVDLEIARARKILIMYRCKISDDQEWREQVMSPVEFPVFGDDDLDFQVITEMMTELGVIGEGALGHGIAEDAHDDLVRLLVFIRKLPCFEERKTALKQSSPEVRNDHVPESIFDVEASIEMLYQCRLMPKLFRRIYSFFLNLAI